MNSKEIIKKLDMTPHPEGGYYKEIYRTDKIANLIIDTKPVNRSFATSIYFLLEGEQFSSFHKLRSDELWYYHAGSAARVHIIEPDGNYSFKDVGFDLENDVEPQIIIKANCWFASEVLDKNSYSLVGCMVAPGFDFADFELAERKQLVELFPDHKEIITKFTRENDGQTS